MNKMLISLALAITFATPLESAPLSVPKTAQSLPHVLLVQDWDRDGDRDWRR